jgi:hypothetical protein
MNRRSTMRIRKLAGFFLGVLFLLGAVALLANAAGAQEKPQKEEFAAWAVNLGGAIKSGQVMITIERWSTPEERNQLIAAFKEKGQDGLFKVLTKMPSVGYIRIPQTTAWTLHYAYQFPQEDGGRVIIIGTDRKVGMREAASSTRSMDYPFELIQMKLDKDGKGEGKLSAATKISLSKDGTRIELENYGTAPVSLENIHRVGEKEKEKEPEK